MNGINYLLIVCMLVLLILELCLTLPAVTPPTLLELCREVRSDNPNIVVTICAHPDQSQGSTHVYRLCAPHSM